MNGDFSPTTARPSTGEFRRTSDALLLGGRVLLGLSLAAFGVQYFVYGRFTGGLVPAAGWTPPAPGWALAMGAVLLAGGICIAVTPGRVARTSAILLGFLFLACVLVLHASRPSVLIHDASERTGALEPLAMSGALWALAGLLGTGRGRGDATDRNASRLLLAAGRVLFAFPMIVFGVQHFMLGSFIASLIPSWIPFPLFWAFFTGAGFVLAGIAILAGRYARATSMLLGAMFFLWVVCLHAPRVIAHLEKGDEWSSLFVALALSGGAFVVSATPSRSFLRARQDENPVPGSAATPPAR